MGPPITELKDRELEELQFDSRAAEEEREAARAELARRRGHPVRTTPHSVVAGWKGWRIAAPLIVAPIPLVLYVAIAVTEPEDAAAGSLWVKITGGAILAAAIAGESLARGRRTAGVVAFVIALAIAIVPQSIKLAATIVRPNVAATLAALNDIDLVIEDRVARHPVAGFSVRLPEGFESLDQEMNEAGLAGYAFARQEEPGAAIIFTVAEIEGPNSLRDYVSGVQESVGNRGAAVTGVEHRGHEARLVTDLPNVPRLTFRMVCAPHEGKWYVGQVAVMAPEDEVEGLLAALERPRGR